MSRARTSIFRFVCHRELRSSPRARRRRRCTPARHRGAGPWGQLRLQPNPGRSPARGTRKYRRFGAGRKMRRAAWPQSRWRGRGAAAEERQTPTLRRRRLSMPGVTQSPPHAANLALMTPCAVLNRPATQAARLFAVAGRRVRPPSCRWIGRLATLRRPAMDVSSLTNALKGRKNYVDRVSEAAEGEGVGAPGATTRASAAVVTPKSETGFTGLINQGARGSPPRPADWDAPSAVEREGGHPTSHPSAARRPRPRGHLLPQFPAPGAVSDNRVPRGTLWCGHAPCIGDGRRPRPLTRPLLQRGPTARPITAPSGCAPHDRCVLLTGPALSPDPPLRRR